MVESYAKSITPFDSESDFASNKPINDTLLEEMKKIRGPDFKKFLTMFGGL